MPTLNSWCALIFVNKQVMKKLLTTLFLATLFASASAVPAKPGQFRMITLSNGTKVRAELKGDEHFSFYMGDDKNAYVRIGKEDVYERMELSRIHDIHQARMMERTAHRAKMLPSARKAKYQGSKKGIVILVQFPDAEMQPENTLDLFNRMLNEEGFNHNDLFKGSVHDYFHDQSYGQFDLSFDVVGPYTLPQTRPFYGTPTGNSHDSHPGAMVQKACEMAYKDGLNFSKYDWDGDGYVDQVYVLYAGLGQANGGDAETIWPHEWTLSSSDYGRTYKAGDVYINTYACGAELMPTRYGNVLAGIGTLCHEFTHCLGIPDFYDTQDTGNYGMGSWDLMCNGSYNNNGYTPPSYTAYERNWVGWLTPIELTKSADITGIKGMAEGGQSYIIRNDNPDPSVEEYFLLENRKKTGWDEHVPGEGLLITHVDYNARMWQYNVVNSNAYGNDHQRCFVVLADQDDKRTTGANDVFPYRDHNSFSDSSSPKASWFNYNSVGNRLFRHSIKNITRADDGSISFKFKEANDEEEGPEDYSGIEYENAIFAETFNRMANTGGNDGNWSGNIASGFFRGSDVNGWSYSSGNAGLACAKFGDTTTTSGYAMTPAFTINGVTTLFFAAAAWGEENTKLTLSVSNESGSATTPVLGTTEFTLRNGSWKVYATTLTGNGSVKVKFTSEGEESSRFFLDGVAVHEGDRTAIERIGMDSDVVSYELFDLSGRRLTAPTKGLVIIRKHLANGKTVTEKIIK